MQNQTQTSQRRNASKCRNDGETRCLLSRPHFPTLGFWSRRACFLPCPLWTGKAGTPFQMASRIRWVTRLSTTTFPRWCALVSGLWMRYLISWSRHEVDGAPHYQPMPTTLRLAGSPLSWRSRKPASFATCSCTFSPTLCSRTPCRPSAKWRASFRANSLGFPHSRMLYLASYQPWHPSSAVCSFYGWARHFVFGPKLACSWLWCSQALFLFGAVLALD